MATLRTKEELEKEITELKQVIDELQSQISARDAALSQTGEPGWLVTSPNPNYGGLTAGVEFRRGRAFVPKRNENHALVMRLVNDFGYTAREMGSADFQKLGKQEQGAPGPMGVEALMKPTQA